MPTWRSYRPLARPASRLTPLLHYRSPPAHQSTLHTPPLLKPPPFTYSLGLAGQVWYAQLQSRTPEQLSPFQFGHSTTRIIIATMTLLGDYAKNTSLSIPAYTSSFSLHSFPSLLRLPRMYNVLPSRHGDEEPLSQVTSREYDRGTLHLSQ